MDDLAYVYRTQGYYSTSHRDIAILTDIDRSPFFIADHCNQAGIVGLGSVSYTHLTLPTKRIV